MRIFFIKIFEILNKIIYFQNSQCFHSISGNLAEIGTPQQTACRFFSGAVIMTVAIAQSIKRRASNRKAAYPRFDFPNWQRIVASLEKTLCAYFPLGSTSLPFVVLVTSGGSRKFWWGGFEAQNLKNSDVFTKIESDFSAEVGNSNVFFAHVQVVSKKKKKKGLNQN